MIRTEATPTYPAGTPTFAPTTAQTPAANTAAVATLAAQPGSRWKLENVRWSYSGAPTNGQLVIAWTDPTAGNVQETYSIAAAGLGSLALNKIFPSGSAVTITLAAGGNSISGTVYADAECPVA